MSNVTAGCEKNAPRIALHHALRFDALHSLTHRDFDASGPLTHRAFPLTHRAFDGSRFPCIAQPRTSHTSPFGLRLPASAAESPPAPPSSYAFSAARAARCSSSKRLWSAIRSTSFAKSRPHLPHSMCFFFSALGPQLLRVWFLGGFLPDLSQSLPPPEYGGWTEAVYVYRVCVWRNPFLSMANDRNNKKKKKLEVVACFPRPTTLAPCQKLDPLLRRFVYTTIAGHRRASHAAVGVPAE